MRMLADGTREHVYRIKEVAKVTDGDTYWFHLDVGFRATLFMEVRLDGFDTPEKNKGTAFEKAQAKEAWAMAQAFLLTDRGPGFKLWVQTGEADGGFSRWLGDVWLERPDGSEIHLGDWLREHKLASIWPQHWREEFDKPKELREEDLEFEYYHAEGQPIHQGPRGVKLRYKPTGEIFHSHTRRSQLENKEAVIRILKRVL